MASLHFFKPITTVLGGAEPSLDRWFMVRFVPLRIRLEFGKLVIFSLKFASSEAVRLSKKNQLISNYLSC